jgi:nickel-dependent lactate racemase
MHIQLAYGRHGLDIELPDDVPVTIIESSPRPGLALEGAAIIGALREPIGSPPLRELVGPSDTVAIVFSDLTRPMPNSRVLPPLLAELTLAGVPDSNIVLLNALGTHRPQTDAELEGMLGPAAQRYRIVQHDAWDAAQLGDVCPNRMGRMVRVNRAYLQATIRILTGFIEPHFFAGFSGGPKAVLPGIADIESILDNHSPAMLAHPKASWAFTEACSMGTHMGNPLWLEMLEVAQHTRPTFLLNVTLNKHRQITQVFAGELLAAHRAGVDFVRQSAMFGVNEPFDVVITSNSGYPLDLNLYQSVKGMSAAARIVRRGGDIIVAAECWDGIPEHGHYKRLLWEADAPDPLLENVMAPGFRCHDQWQAQTQAQIQMHARVHVYCDGISDEELRRALVIPCRSIEDTVESILSQRPGANLAVLPDGPQTVPYLRAGDGD